MKQPLLFDYSGAVIHLAALSLLSFSLFSSFNVNSAPDPALQESDDYMSLSLAELGNIEVTSVAKKPQALGDSAAAVFVITQEEIRRSGVTTIADALRMAPGVQVAKLSASQWAISIRGFNDIFSNKLLVLIDGRTVYSPFFGGTYWDVQDSVLEDIERIEIVRGSGGTLWGANAVNGVINIITKSADETQGILVSALAGNEERGTMSLRYGDTLNEKSHYRLYGKVFEKNQAEGGSDDWRMGRAGFRLDSEQDPNNDFTVQGDIYIGEEGERATPPADIPPFGTFDSETDVAGGNVLFRWNHIFDNDADFVLQAYYDRSERKHFYIEDKRNTFDIDFQHRLARLSVHEFFWGLGYRFISDDTNAGSLWSLQPSARRYDRFSGFVQDEIRLVDERLILTVGSKFEHNDFTGFEYQPSARFSWKTEMGHVLWGSVSRAVRTPSRIEHDVFLLRQPLAPGLALAIAGDRDMDSETLIAYELGYRVFSSKGYSLDLATFYYDYSNLRSLENGFSNPQVIPSAGLVALPLVLDNKLRGESYGAEIAAQWQVTDIWKLQAVYSYLQLQLHLDRSSSDITEEGDEGDSPHHQFSLSSRASLTSNLEFDTAIRFVDSVAATNSKPDIDAYVTMDLRLGWRPTESVDLSLVGRNLFGDHREFRGSTVLTEATDVEPSVFVKLAWTWDR